MQQNSTPDDTSLTIQGYTENDRQGGILLLACGALAREILHLKSGIAGII